MSNLEIAGVATPPPGAAHVRLPYLRVAGESDLYRILDPDLNAPGSLLRLRERELHGPDFVTWEAGVSSYQPGTSLFVAAEDLIEELNGNRHSSEAFSRFLKRLRESSAAELPQSCAGGARKAAYRSWVVRASALHGQWSELAESVISPIERQVRSRRSSFYKFDEGHELLRALEMIGLLLDRRSVLRGKAIGLKERILGTTDASDSHEDWLATKKAIVRRWREADFPNSEPVTPYPSPPPKRPIWSMLNASDLASFRRGGLPPQESAASA